MAKVVVTLTLKPYSYVDMFNLVIFDLSMHCIDYHLVHVSCARLFVLASPPPPPSQHLEYALFKYHLCSFHDLCI